MDIGIIGGADGPTSMFVASQGDGTLWLLTGCVIALALLLAWRRARK